MKIKIHRTISFPVFLYGYETWSPTLKEEHRLYAFKERVPRKIFWTKSKEVTRR
jgi:hypothetical protein